MNTCRLRWAFLVSLCAPGIFIACSNDSSSGGSPSRDDGGTSTPDGGTSTDSGAPGSDSAAPDAGPGSTGSVSIRHGSGFAYFLDGIEPKDTLQKVDASCVRKISVKANPDLKKLAAGTLTFTGGLLPGAGVTAEQGSTGSYSATLPKPAFMGGEVFTVKAAGGAVPAFTIMTPKAPVGRVNLSATPSWSTSSNTPTTIPRNKDLVVTWSRSPTDVNEGTLSLDFTDPGASDSTLVCSFPAFAGTGTISTATLSTLKTGNASIIFHVETRETKRVGTFDVDLTLGGEVRTNNGADAELVYISLQ